MTNKNEHEITDQQYFEACVGGIQIYIDSMLESKIRYEKMITKVIEGLEKKKDELTEIYAKNGKLDYTVDVEKIVREIQNEVWENEQL